MLTITQKEQLISQVAVFVEMGNSKMGTNLPMPTVVFKKRGACGGTALSSKNELDFNSGLASENFDEYMNQVVPHEVAHLLKDKKYGSARGRGPNSAHGSNWQRVMMTLGVRPDRTHSMDVSNQSTRRPQNKFIYRCEGCQKEIVMGPKHHKKVLAGNSRLRHKGCGGASITYLHPAGAVSWVEAKEKTNNNSIPTPAPGAPKKVATLKDTKINRALIAYKAAKEHKPEITRQEMLALLVDIMDITVNQAVGLYQNCKKRAA